IPRARPAGSDALRIVLLWQSASLAFFVYVALVAELRRGAPARARPGVWTGSALGAAGAIAASRLPPDGLANVWIFPPSLLLLGGSGPLVAFMFVAALAVSAGAVFGRYHYAADALAGWAVAVIVYYAL